MSSQIKKRSSIKEEEIGTARPQESNQDPKKEAKSWLPIITSLSLIFGGCIVNNIFLELMIQQDKTAGSFITLAQFLLIICLEGLGRISIVRTTDNAIGVKLAWKERKIPFLREEGKAWHNSYRTYGMMGTVFYVVSVLNNEVFRFDISMPLHMIFRSCSLVVNLLMGLLVFKRVYPISKIFAAILVSVGIFMATVASSQQTLPSCGTLTQTCADPIDDVVVANNVTDSQLYADALGMDVDALHRWLLLLFGVFLLFSTSFLSSLLGLIQEQTYKLYGQLQSETAFYSHLITLPLFIPQLPSMIQSLQLWTASPLSIAIPLTPYSLPYMVFLLIGNCISQYACIRGVFLLLGLTDSLTCTLSLSVRKFTSLLISIIYFSHSFTSTHWIGTLFVFAGTLLYTFDLSHLFSSLKSHPH